MSIAIGLFVGLVLGLTGAGGSIFAVPLLILLLQLSASDAMTIALAAVSASAFIGTIGQRKSVLWVPAIFLSLGGILVAPLGKWLALMANDTLLVMGFVAIALWIAQRMYQQAVKQPELALHVRGQTGTSDTDTHVMTCKLSPTGQFQLKPRCISGLLIGGVLIGFASGLFGVGGGFLIVPLILALSAISMQKAIATSLATITVISAAGFISHLLLHNIAQGMAEPSDQLPMQILVNVVAAAIFGMLLSQGLSRHLAGPKLQKTFAVLLIIVSAMLFIKQWI